MSVVIYTSLVAASTAVDKKTRKIEAILTGHKIEFEKVDVANDEEAKQKLKDNKPEGQVGLVLPQIWSGDQFRTDCEGLVDANEWGETKKILGLE